MCCPDIIPEASVKRQALAEKFLYCAELTGGCENVISRDRNREWHYILLCTHGSIILDFEDRTVTVEKGFLNLSNAVFPSRIRMGKKFGGYIVGIEFELFLDTLRGRGGIPIDYGRGFRHLDFVSNLPSEKLRMLEKDCRGILSSLENTDHYMAKERSYAHCFILLTDIIDAMWTMRESIPPVHEDSDHGDEIVRQFMREASKNIEKEFQVAFYAEKLFVSKQHLSDLVLRKTDHTIGNVLATFRYERCLRMVKDPRMTLQPIASQMSFPDPSAFGKFFKRHNGMSPARYRRMHGIG